MGRFARLTDDQLDLTTDVPNFMGDITNDLGNLGTHTDGFDLVFEDLATQVGTAVDAGGVLDDDLGALDTSVPGIAPNSLDSDHASLPGTLSEGNAILSDSSDLLGSVTPAPQPPGGGGAPPPSSDCGKRTNKYGISKKGSFPGVKCDWQLTFQVLRVQDGTCTYSADPSPPPGASTTVVIQSFALVQGDASVWSLGHHTFHPDNAPALDVIDVKVTPGTPGHFDAVGVLNTTRPTQKLHVCMSVDVIP